MTLRKWNYKTRDYEPYEVPDEWNVKTFSMDMDEIVNCPNCGRTLTFGETYTSMQIHAALGMGYGVCRECYEKEWQEEKAAKGGAI